MKNTVIANRSGGGSESEGVSLPICLRPRRKPRRQKGRRPNLATGFGVALARLPRRLANGSRLSNVTVRHPVRYENSNGGWLKSKRLIFLPGAIGHFRKETLMIQDGFSKLEIPDCDLEFGPWRGHAKDRRGLCCAEAERAAFRLPRCRSADNRGSFSSPPKLCRPSVSPVRSRS